jgi:hypothetical protein
MDKYHYFPGVVEKCLLLASVSQFSMSLSSARPDRVGYDRPSAKEVSGPG